MAARAAYSGDIARFALSLRKVRVAGPMHWCAGTGPGRWLTDGERLLVWEYPRQAPDGDQVDLVEVMEIADGLIQYHRVYWGWFGTALLTRSAVDKVRKMA